RLLVLLALLLGEFLLVLLLLGLLLTLVILLGGLGGRGGAGHHQPHPHAQKRQGEDHLRGKQLAHDCSVAAAHPVAPAAAQPRGAPREGGRPTGRPPLTRADAVAAGPPRATRRPPRSVSRRTPNAVLVPNRPEGQIRGGLRDAKDHRRA